MGSQNALWGISLLKTHLIKHFEYTTASLTNGMLDVKPFYFIMSEKLVQLSLKLFFYFIYFFLWTQKYCSICCQLAVNLTFNYW